MERSQSHPEPLDGWTINTLKEYFERVITDRDVALKMQVDDRDRALRLAVVELERRLDNLNHAHEQAKEKERDFYSRQQHDDFAKSIHLQLEQIRKDVEEMRHPQWTTWIAAMMLLLTTVGSLWYFATQPINLELAHQKDSDMALAEKLKAAEKTSETRDMVTNNRIDKLYSLYELVLKNQQQILQNTTPKR